jgi:hypothetical protein
VREEERRGSTKEKSLEIEKWRHRTTELERKSFK